MSTGGKGRGSRGGSTVVAMAATAALHHGKSCRSTAVAFTASSSSEARWQRILPSDASRSLSPLPFSSSFLFCYPSLSLSSSSSLSSSLSSSSSSSSSPLFRKPSPLASHLSTSNHSVSPLTQRRCITFSTAAAAAAAAATASATASASAATTGSSVASLRRIASPFLMLCHPDRTPLVAQHAEDDRSRGTSAREANLRAVQALNGWIDSVEAAVERASSSLAASTSGVGKVVVPRSVEIEFLVPSSSSSSSSSSSLYGTRGPKNETATLTRRSVVLSLPESDLELLTSTSAAAAARRLRLAAGRQVGRLLRAAGCGTEGYREWRTAVAAATETETHVDDDDNDDDEDDVHDGRTEGRRRRRSTHDRYGPAEALMEEMDLDGSRASRYGAGPRFDGNYNYDRRHGRADIPPMTPYERSRRRFMNSIDWNAQRATYERVYGDALADLATHGMLSRSDERRADLIGVILSKVRVVALDDDHGDGSNNNNDDGGGNDSDEEGEDKERHAARARLRRLDSLGLGPVGQLIAVRRLSLLLEDNFDDLQMERLGRTWENLTIVLMPQRSGRATTTTGREAGATRRNGSNRRVRRGMARESGFKFAYGGGGGGKGEAHLDNDNDDDDDDDNDDALAVTAYVPVDFEDEEILGEFRRHLRTYWSRHLHSELLELFPRHVGARGVFW